MSLCVKFAGREERSEGGGSWEGRTLTMDHHVLHGWADSSTNKPGACSAPALGQSVAARPPQRQGVVVRCCWLCRLPRRLLLHARIWLPGVAAATPGGAAPGGGEVLILEALRASQREGLLCGGWAGGGMRVSATGQGGRGSSFHRNA